VDAGVVIEEGVRLESRVRIYNNVHLEQGVRVFDGAVLGGDPQDLKYAGEESFLHIEEGVVIREYCTLNRGTQGQTTRIGKHSLLMAYVHVGHDCQLAERVVLANGVQLGGHVEIGAYAILGGNTAVQQFSCVGSHAFVGGTLKIDRNVPPGVRAFGDPLRYAGINKVGLERRGWSEEQIQELSRAYKRLYRAPAGERRLLLQKEEWPEILINFYQCYPTAEWISTQRS
jgi:UDP-N-acetylglucosamine acyltransferase